MRILLIEDDELLGDGLVAGLKLNGFDAEWLRDGEGACDILRLESFDVLVLDLGLPRMDGLSVLRQVRREGLSLPCLIITARDQINDRVEGLDAGADDYLCKPFALDEFFARLRALCRRPKQAQNPQLEVGELSLDLNRIELRKNGKLIDLPRKEFQILECLMRAPDKVFSRNELEERLYGWNQDIQSNALDVHIHELRRKLGKQRIRTVRGVGYTLNLNE